jgi:hypothetical protein
MLSEQGQPFTVKYDPLTKTVFLINVDYYGWVKSIALAVAGDILEDDHWIYSVHCAMIDLGCMGFQLLLLLALAKLHIHGVCCAIQLRA